MRSDVSSCKSPELRVLPLQRDSRGSEAETQDRTLRDVESRQHRAQWLVQGFDSTKLPGGGNTRKQKALDATVRPRPGPPGAPGRQLH